MHLDENYQLDVIHACGGVAVPEDWIQDKVARFVIYQTIDLLQSTYKALWQEEH